MESSDLVGVWRLCSLDYLDEKGERHEGPLGLKPDGVLFYSADGHVSVSIMRIDGSIVASGKEYLTSQRYMIYAGTWRRVGNQVFHAIHVAQDPEWVLTEQIRDLVLAGDRLTLSEPRSERSRRQILDWRRIADVDS